MNRWHGFTLVEVLTVVAILSVLALFAMPAREPVEAHQLERATHEAADAIRFARSEALRTQQAYGFAIESGNARLRLFRTDTSASPATLTYDVLHPLTRQAYVVDFGPHSSLPSIALTATTSFTAACTSPTNIVFDGTAEPRCVAPVGSLLSSGNLTLSLGGNQRSLIVDGTTGRVRVP